MVSSTLAVVLALTLACTGGMFLLIAKQVQGRSGMATFALGLALFGLVFAVPDDFDARAGLFLGVVLDSIAVAAVLLLRRGLQRFMHSTSMSWRQLIAALAVFAVVSAAVRLAIGDAARPLVLDVTLAFLFAWLAYTAWRDSHRDNPQLRLPLSLLSMVLGVLAVLSLGQALHVLALGSASADSTAQTEAVYEIVLMLGALLLGPTLLWLHTVQLSRQLSELATRDPLTRLLNENGLDDVLRRHFARRHHEPVALMHIDVDHFAKVNDDHGESAGDDVLRMIGLALESGLRADDFVARVGGEEFVVGCVSADVGKAAVLGERLRAAVAAMQTGLSNAGGMLRCTVSVGISRPFSDIEQWRAAWAEAEVSLQAAKDAGCNCVVHPTTA
jgi:diguanylate cyclase (GGDEF)-like protein